MVLRLAAGRAAGGDFSFLVIGDPGEGDASQHVLRDQVLAVAARDDVKFVVISSDVIYPTGAMKDYEAKFWLPFKGTHKPVYAIPGQPRLVRRARGVHRDVPRARRRAHGDARTRRRRQRHLGTTDARIEELIGKAAVLPAAVRRADGVPARAVLRGADGRLRADRRRHGRGAQRGPGAVAMARGGPRGGARARRSWPCSAIRSTPAARYLADGDTSRSRRIHDAARGATACPSSWPGDTHDLEYYVEDAGRGAPPVQHFVNGGGGAYLSFGTALAWPASPATTRWGFYPRVDQVRSKIEANMTLREAAALVVDRQARRLAVLGGVAVVRVRLQRRAVLPELRRGARRAVGAARAHHPVRDRGTSPVEDFQGSPDFVPAGDGRG